MQQPRPGTVRLGISILLLALGLLASGCFFGDPPGVFEDTPCECPNTERIALDTDWFGDGRPADSLYSYAIGPDEDSDTSVVSLKYDGFAGLADANAALNLLESHFAESGLPPLEQFDPTTGILQTDDARLTVYSPFVDRGEELLFIDIKVSLFVDDERAAEVLAPLVEPLGTLG